MFAMVLHLTRVAPGLRRGLNTNPHALHCVGTGAVITPLSLGGQGKHLGKQYKQFILFIPFWPRDLVSTKESEFDILVDNDLGFGHQRSTSALK